ncbi:MAG: hypothetical protein H0V96_08645 [Acidimicrobiia bacterium]|nr:hypothetical protein [Acidimicrobiia bacterium]
MTAAIDVTLDAVIVAVTDDRPRILTVAGPSGPPRIPSGPLDPELDKTLEQAMRRWIDQLAGVGIGYAEQLYTFGDRKRGSRRDGAARWLSVAYLALVREEVPPPGASWVDVYDLFPWEDHREGRPALIDGTLLPALEAWAGSAPSDASVRSERIAVMFGREAGWDGIRVLERYELLYEAGLVTEAHVDAGTPPTSCQAPVAGTTMASDDRRIAATALGRLRGKLTYRPVVFELLPDRFTLSLLQRTVEALSGMRLHTQNFRRLVERNRLVEGTGVVAATGGRPGELFRFRPEVYRERPRPGVGVPYR